MRRLPEIKLYDISSEGQELAKNKLIGIVSCSDEDCLGGTVTICLPLYLAGGEERGFMGKQPTVAYALH